jgi:hypothetical protein
VMNDDADVKPMCNCEICFPEKFSIGLAVLLS